MIPFNKWSRERIRQGRKFATTRDKVYLNEKCVFSVARLPLWFVKQHLWQIEGADSPEEFEKVWREIHRGQFEADKFYYTHFGDFREQIKEL